MASPRLTATFALPRGGAIKIRLRVPGYVGVHSRGSICAIISRASRVASRRGVKLGNCLRIEQPGQLAAYVYQLDNGGLR